MKRCDCCGTHKAVCVDEECQRLGLGFCLLCVAAAKDYAACPHCQKPLPLPEAVCAAITRKLLACTACTAKIAQVRPTLPVELYDNQAVADEDRRRVTVRTGAGI